MSALVEECVFDACIADNPQEQMCNAFGKYAKLCAGEDITGWREETKCRKCYWQSETNFFLSYPESDLHTVSIVGIKIVFLNRKISLLLWLIA